MTSGGGGSGRDREDVVGGIGAVGNGKWMSPYALYALDWCKWPVSNGGYGRVAMCSYAEDSHNYVSFVHLGGCRLSSEWCWQLGGEAVSFDIQLTPADPNPRYPTHPRHQRNAAVHHSVA